MRVDLTYINVNSADALAEAVERLRLDGTEELEGVEIQVNPISGAWQISYRKEGRSRCISGPAFHPLARENFKSLISHTWEGSTLWDGATDALDLPTFYNVN